MVNYLDELATKPKRWWGFWVLAPVILLSCVGMTLAAFNRESQTTFGQALIVLIDLVALLLLLGLWNARRFYWCFRAIGLVVFCAYAWYLFDEFTRSDQPAFDKPARRGEQSPVNSLLGFVIIGIPALIFALRPGPKAGPGLQEIPAGTDGHPDLPPPSQR
jgi:hypothetical protein